jgi:hypothetical protein
MIKNWARSKNLWVIVIPAQAGIHFWYVQTLKKSSCSLMNRSPPARGRQFFYFFPQFKKILNRLLDKQYYVYILVSKKYGTFYIGMTSNLIERIYAHKQKYVDGIYQEIWS